MIHTYGFLNNDQSAPLQRAMSHTDTFYGAMFDRQALWDPATIDRVIAGFPKNKVEEGDLFLILAECIANAVLHGQAEVFAFHARQRGDALLLSFMQSPPMQTRVSDVLSMARQGTLRDSSADMPGGLGFPILLKLVHKITISPDCRKLQLWLRVKAE